MGDSLSFAVNNIKAIDRNWEDKFKAMQTQRRILVEVEISSDAHEFDQCEQLKAAIDTMLSQTLQLPDVGSQYMRSARVTKVIPQRSKRTHKDVQLPRLPGTVKQQHEAN